MTLPAVRKISETIVDFGEPLLHQLDPDQPYEAVRSTFECPRNPDHGRVSRRGSE
jgi:hypothetical protein